MTTQELKTEFEKCVVNLMAQEYYEDMKSKYNTQPSIDLLNESLVDRVIELYKFIVPAELQLHEELIP